MRDHFFLYVFDIVPVKLGWEFLSASLADHSSVMSLALYSDRTSTYQATESGINYKAAFIHNVLFKKDEHPDEIIYFGPISIGVNLTQNGWYGQTCFSVKNWQ
jgi:hypothetical protein